MSDNSFNTNRFNTVTIIKMCFMAFLICGFVYSCNNAKGKKSNKNNKAVTQQNDKTQGNKTQTNQASKQVSKQTNSQSPTKKKKKITKNWKTFFSGETDTQTRIQLLQHGQKFKKALQSFSQSDMAQKASASVNGIKLNDDKTATVSYTINIGGAPVLKGKTGKALYLDGTWKVGAAAFCGLIELSGNTPEPCQGVGQ